VRHVTGILIFTAVLGLFTASTCGAGDNGPTPVVAEVSLPRDTDGSAVKWHTVTVPDLGVLLIAVARPKKVDASPALLLLHGTHGFAREYVGLAKALAREGRFAVAACWFEGGAGSGAQFVTPIACPDAPAMSPASSDLAFRTVHALVRAVRTLPDVAPVPVALFGHSRGGGAALNYVLKGGEARALILNSVGYPAEVADRAAQIDVPVLILHGTADSSAEGGSTFTAITMARNFELSLRRAARPVTARYYDGSGHNGVFTNPWQFDDEVRRIAAFATR
jgi:pimeloyl-ACP methyl ester carboxylesterase